MGQSILGLTENGFASLPKNVCALPEGHPSVPSRLDKGCFTVNCIKVLANWRRLFLLVKCILH